MRGSSRNEHRRCSRAHATAKATRGTVPRGSDEHQTTVRPGQSIQAAIDAASPGTRIDVQAGTYHENLEITKDGIHLNGHDAILEPPTSRHATRCDVFPEGGAGTGICFAGVFDPNTLAVSAPLNDAELEGFIVRGFAGNGALAESSGLISFSPNTSNKT